MTSAAGGDALLPNQRRTTLLNLTTNNLGSNCVGGSGFSFNPSAAGGAGIITLPGGRRVSANPGDADCLSAPACEPIVPITTGDSAIPAAVQYGPFTRDGSNGAQGCGMINKRTYVFPAAAGVPVVSDPVNGEVSGQTLTLDDTRASGVGNTPPGHTVGTLQTTPDGFQLLGDCTSGANCQLVIFMADKDGAAGAGLAAGAFLLSPDGTVNLTSSPVDNIEFNTPTPTTTPTPTITITPTVTETPTITPTPTITQTPTITPTRTLTPTATAAPDDCCECQGESPTCQQPVSGQCTLVCPSGTPPVLIRDAVCIVEQTPAGGRCATPTPTPTPTHTPLPDCLRPDDDGDLTLNPGYCGPTREDCAQELCFEQPISHKPNGLPVRDVQCTDGDPVCDFGPAGDRACLFHYAVCLDLKDVETRFPCTHDGPITHTRMLFPSETNPKTDIAKANVAAFEAAMIPLGAIPGSYKEKKAMIFDPPKSGPLCTGFADFKVEVKQNPRTFALRPGRFRMVIRSGITGDPREDGDHIYFKCFPAP